MQKILVIENNAEIRESLLLLLEAEGYTVTIAIDGHSGIQLAAEQHPDLIVCATALGDTEGHEVLTQLQQNAELAVLPFILLSDRADPQYLRKSMEMGADDCLIKPFTETELTAAIAARLGKQHAITERYVNILRHTAERLNRLAHYDSLTDLPNHRLLYQRLTQSIQKAIQRNQHVALISVSLDRLRQVNNVMGYLAGDSLLQATAQRLTACLPKSATVARLTGNQFAVLLTAFQDRQAVVAASEEIIDCLSRPFSLPGQEVFVTASIGIALYPEDTQDINVLLRQADAALDWAKQQKSHYYQFYRTDMPVVSSDEIVLETWLRYALERQEFEVYYQPQKQLKSGKITGAEALIRWCHPEKGYISPSQFIPLAEETGLIVPIGEWILRTVCQQTRAWQQEGLPLIRIAVNLSSVQFNQPHLTHMVAQILTETALDPAYLELELTETALMKDTETAICLLKELKDLGLCIAIDDFGTGYSSLSYLKQLPIDMLKIDNCFVRGVTADVKNIAILTAVIQMAHNLQLGVIAEGVETPHELDFLIANNCDVVQGNFVSPPLSKSDMQNLLRSQL
ncbi:MAG: GGDEF domain-containing response regulator [Leptolyngbyaceae cyanobacterium SM1_1_3]|nr:GGDEF domain-containing response regulator [Leptolyngbyaceae cyanobacterium SM1_1_3]NJN04240.1 GGDEF domain-containing response regulator [Leptolyngbyaceae cyanobacterium RM1_1_2]